jgi:hypothetical protein
VQPEGLGEIKEEAPHCVSNPRPSSFGFFSLPNPSSHTMALWSTQPLTEMSIVLSQNKVLTA